MNKQSKVVKGKTLFLELKLPDNEIKNLKELLKKIELANFISEFFTQMSDEEYISKNIDIFDLAIELFNDISKMALPEKTGSLLSLPRKVLEKLYERILKFNCAITDFRKKQS